MKGNPEKLDVDMEGRLARIVLSLRLMMILMILMIFMIVIIRNHDYVFDFVFVFLCRREEATFNVVTFHGYASSKKGNRWKKIRNLMIVEN